MVQVSQTEDEIKIIIEMNRLMHKRPVIILMSKYIKFNNPPIFFERHLTREIDETASYCRIFKHEARIILVKKEKGLWPEIFETLSKEELFKKRPEMVDKEIARNKQQDERNLERYEQKRRTEIEREVQRETDMRNKLQKFREEACRDAFAVTPKETHIKDKTEQKPIKSEKKTEKAINSNSTSVPKAKLPPPPIAAVRPTGTIKFNFSNFMYSTPKRESQEGKPRPFIIEDNTSEQPPTETHFMPSN